MKNNYKNTIKYLKHNHTQLCMKQSARQRGKPKGRQTESESVQWIIFLQKKKLMQQHNLVAKPTECYSNKNACGSMFVLDFAFLREFL